MRALRMGFERSVLGCLLNGHLKVRLRACLKCHLKWLLLPMLATLGCQSMETGGRVASHRNPKIVKSDRFGVRPEAAKAPEYRYDLGGLAQQSHIDRRLEEKLKGHYDDKWLTQEHWRVENPTYTREESGVFSLEPDESKGDVNIYLIQESP